MVLLAKRYDDVMMKYITKLNVLKLLATELVLKAFLNDSNKKHVRVFSGNSTVMTYIILAHRNNNNTELRKCQLKRNF